MSWKTIERLRGANVHVVGLASTEGAAMVRFLWSEGVRRLTAHDFQPAQDVEQAFKRMHVGMPRPERDRVWAAIEDLPIELRLGESYLDGIDSADAVFAGQAWYLYAPNLPRLPDLQARGVPFHSLTELYFGLWPSPILAVTGSNGKSTTSRLVEAILRETDREVFYAGNERRSIQVLDKIRDAAADAWLVLEVSNRQLIDLRPRPRIGVVTNILPNHLDEHGGEMAEYAAVKRRLLGYQGANDIAVLNADNAESVRLADGLSGQVYWFSRTAKAGESRHLSEGDSRGTVGAWLEHGSIRIRLRDGHAPLDAGPVPSRQLPGSHNVENALAASLAAALAGADDKAIRRGLERFRGLRHRIQFVWAADGVEYYDDLNATTPEATLAALRALDTPIVLIAGGGDKGLELAQLAATIRERVRWLVLLPGEGSERLEAALQPAGTASGAGEAGGPAATQLGPEVSRIATLGEAVEAVVAGAGPGDRVLLSPACPYFFRMHYLDGAGRELGFKKLLRQATAQRTEDKEGAT